MITCCFVAFSEQSCWCAFLNRVFVHLLVQPARGLPVASFFTWNSNKRLETAGDSALSGFARDAANSFRKPVEASLAVAFATSHQMRILNMRKVPRFNLTISCAER